MNDKPESNLFDLSREKIGNAWDSLGKAAKDYLAGNSAKAQNSSQAKEIINRQQQLLERVMPAVEPPFWPGIIVSLSNDKKEALVSCQGKLSYVNTLKGKDLKAGDSIKLSSVTGQIVDIATEFDIGSIATIKNVVDKIFSEVDGLGGIRMVLNGSFSDTVQADDRVILDSSGSIIIARLGKGDPRFKLGFKPTLTWNDIGGLESAKRELIEAFEWPIKYASLYKDYKKPRIRGALLYGPPGCGKTMFIGAIATAVAKLYGAEAVESGFILVRGPEVLEPLVGNAEKNIRNLFTLGRKHEEKYGYPAIIAIDECEALLARRGSGISSDMEKTVVPTFLAEMNGLGDYIPIIILATNRPKTLDPAVIRDKRIDRHVKVPRPDKIAAEEIFKKNFEKTLVAKGLSADELAKYAADEFYSDKYKLWDIKTKNGDKFFNLCHLVSGAMISGVVDKTSSAALERDIDAKSRSGTGITKEDIVDAAQKTFEQKRDLDHSDEIMEFVEEFKDDILPGGITKVIQKNTP